MNTFFTSDIHFQHCNILSFAPNRGKVWKTVEEMNNGLRDNWNAVVQPGDTVYLLGDLAFERDPEIVAAWFMSLNGQKHLIYGNHDEVIQKNEAGFANVFHSIQYYKEIRLNGRHICLFHFASRVWNQSHRGAWMLFGHTHDQLPPYGKSVDVGIDSHWITGKHEHRPFSFEEVSEFMDKQPVYDPVIIK